MKPQSQSQTGLYAMALAVPFVVLFSLVAAAQHQNQVRGPAGQTSIPPATGTPAPAAPVGHRQPTMNALPPSVRKEETELNRARDDLGPMQSICSRC